MARYSLVLLDADGTLFDYDRAEAYALETTCKELGLHYEPKRDLPTYRQINDAMWRAFERGEIDPDALKTRRFADTLEAMGQSDAVRPEEMADRYLEHLAEGSFLIPGVLPMVRELSRLARLAVITNGLARVQRSRFSRSGLAHYVDHLVISDEVGSQKPQPGIFEVALSPFGEVARKEVLIVGDSLTSDIEGGVRYGIDTCWYNPEGRANPNGPHPTYEVRRLDEIPGVVASGK
ncbi:MAG: YjjG family noncanonical pyrimidine nucleotidase [Spirochaetaceae bacterium]